MKLSANAKSAAKCANRPFCAFPLLKISNPKALPEGFIHNTYTYTKISPLLDILIMYQNMLGMNIPSQARSNFLVREFQEVQKVQKVRAVQKIQEV